jgi:hypothetical protein
MEQKWQTERLEHVRIFGHYDRWSEIGRREIKGFQVFLMEDETFGDAAAFVILICDPANGQMSEVCETFDGLYTDTELDQIEDFIEQKLRPTKTFVVPVTYQS